MIKPVLLTAVAATVLASGGLAARIARQVPAAYDHELARSVGADENGMRNYVLVILKTGPDQVPAGPERDAMFRGHFENMRRLSDEGLLALAGPFDGADGWRGLFILAVTTIEEASRIVATDPVIARGEMVAEYHKYYGSAALMLVRDSHARITKKRP